ncbi:MAG TPA: hypothetical protein EYP10_13720, partial [Armatimonadetes bacterium]|nr:hypothetical protein [Armatimonadota bacterium]
MQSRAERGKEQMRELCKKFFNSIGAQCHDDGALLRVSLPASVTSHFDADELDLVFEPTDLMDHPNAELFAPGSRIFDLALKWLREHARLTAIEMPVRYNKHPSAIALTFHGCRIVEQRRRKAHLRGILCSFKASYMPMNKPATVHHVLVFENGFVRDMHIPVDELLINGSSTRRRLSKRSLQQLFNRARLHVERLIALEAEQAQDEFDSDARYEMQRIVNYYDQLLGEMALRVRNHQQFAAEFESIQRERDDKLSEELERHRVRVVVQLIGIVEIHLPVVENLFRIASRDAQADVRSYFDLFEG